MKLFQRILYNLSFLFAAMLLFLLFFQNKISLPPALQAVGRMHPLLLHLPVGLFVLAVIFWLFKKGVEEIAFRNSFLFILHITAFTSLLTALMGLFLSLEGGYEETILLRHKTLGIITALLSFVLLIVYKNVPANKKLTGIILYSAAALLLTGSHFGSNLTHGEGYVWQPLKKSNEATREKITDSSSLFAAAIMPVLEAKCLTCHNEKKAKGGLVMTTAEKIIRGGKNGPVWKAGDALNSHIIQNISLPEEDKKHMPPKGKPQLTAEEINLLFAWIQSGADIKKQIRHYPENDSLKILALKFIGIPGKESKEKDYGFTAASSATIEKLNSPFCAVSALSKNSPALQAAFFIREKYDRKKLNEFLKIKEQLVVLNMGNMPVTDEDLKTISKFSNLEKLVLNNSAITNRGLTELEKLKKLRSLAVAGTKIDKNAAGVFNKIDSLREVFIWNTGITAAEAASLQQQYKRIVFNSGYISSPGEMLALTPPSVTNEEFILSGNEFITLKHQVPGVVIHYTTNNSTPDSITSAVYKDPLTANGFTVIKAIAVKEGWYSSPVAEFSFFKKGARPQQAALLTAPNEKYKASGGATLIDGKKGTAENFSDAAWLGFREQPFAALFEFDKPPTVSSICISYNKSVQSYIMPPEELELWGGDDKTKLKLLKKIKPPQTTKEEMNVIRTEGFNIEIAPAAYKFYKIIARNITKLPAWHPGKGDRGWVFIDEVFFN